MGKGKPKGRDPRYLWVLALSLISFIASIAVYQLHQGSDVASGVCSALGNKSQCDLIGSTPYAKLFGMDNAIIGILGFALMMFLSAGTYFRLSMLYQKLIIAGSIISGVLAVYFIYLQMFVIHAYCFYCLIVDISSLVLLAMAVPEIEKHFL